MPKGARDRQSRRDDARGGGHAGGVGRDADYEWIKYLGEGRSSSGASPLVASPPGAASSGAASSGATSSGGSSSQTSSRSRVPAVAAARSAPPPQPVKRGGPVDPYDTQPPARDRLPRDPWEGRRRHARPVEHPSWPEQQIGYADQQRLATEPPPPGNGQTGRASGPGRAFKVRQGRTTDLLFNPNAEDYGEPLYPPENGKRSRRPERDSRRNGRGGQRGLDTAEYARPLYPYHDAEPITGSRSARSNRDGDPFRDTNSRARLAPARRRPALPPGRSARDSSADGSGGTPALPKRTSHTGAQPRLTGPQPRVTGPQPQVTGPQPRVTGPLPRLTGSQRQVTGPQRRLNDLDLAEGAADTGAGLTQYTGPTAVYVIADVARDGGALAADPEVTSTLAPPRPAIEPDRSRRKAGSAKRAKSRAKPGQGRARAKQRGSQGRARRRVPVMARISLGVVLVAALGVAGYEFLLPKTSHVVAAPARAVGYVRQQADATAEAFKQKIVKAAAGSVSNVVAAVYQRSSGPGTNKGPQVIVFIGGNLTGGSSASSLISAYMTRLKGAAATSAGGLGGQAACAPGSNGGPAECAWADNDTFGVLVSATMNSVNLAAQMRQLRPLVERAK